METASSDSAQNQPYTIADLQDGKSCLSVPLDVLQLQVDCLNVEEGRVSILSFSPERRQQIKDYYRFSATSVNSNTTKVAQRIRDSFK